MISRSEQQKSLERLACFAEKHRGKLLDTAWRGTHVPHRFTDENGYSFTRTPDYLKRWGWPRDNRRSLSPEERHKELSEKAASVGFSLVDEEWLGRHSYHSFVDPFGAAVSLKPAFFLNKKGSRKMRTAAHKHLAQLEAACSARGGKLLSAKWVGASALYDIEDENGIRHRIRGSRLKTGSWPRSNGLTSEPLCRQALEHLFGKPFPKNNTVLTTPLTGSQRSWELDGYCEELQVAFEYQGHSSHWDPTNPAYGVVSRRDQLKGEICKTLGVLLVPIERLPEVRNKWQPDFVLEHVFQSVLLAFEKSGRPLPDMNMGTYSQDLSAIGHPKKMIRQMDELAKSHGGGFLDKQWRGAAKPHLFSFPDGRQFWITPHNLKRQGWPQEPDRYLRRYQVSGHQRLDRLRQDALANGYSLLETSWKGSKHTYHFTDPDGLPFSAPYTTLRVGWPRPGCTKASRLEAIRLLGAAHGCMLLDETWMGNNHSYQFKKPNGLVMRRTAASLLRSGWPTKEVEKACRLEKLRQLGLSNGCVLLDDEWGGNSSRYRFVRKDGSILTLLASTLWLHGWPRREDRFIVASA